MDFCSLLVIFTVCLLHTCRADYFKVTKHIYFDIDIDGKDAGRIVLGLFGEEVPMTVNNFVTLATQGVRGYKYQGSKFHRVIKNFMIQGGDVIHGDGTGSISVYGDTFPDESFRIKHATGGFLSMANSGKDTNGSQFFITLAPTSWLDGRHVVFGKVVEGMDVVETVGRSVVDYQDRPNKDVTIRKSGLLPLDEPYELSDNPNDVWIWLKAIALPLGMSLTVIGFLQYLAYQIPSY